jgi:hypothetical protein
MRAKKKLFSSGVTGNICAEMEKTGGIIWITFITTRSSMVTPDGPQIGHIVLSNKQLNGAGTKPHGVSGNRQSSPEWSLNNCDGGYGAMHLYPPYDYDEVCIGRVDKARQGVSTTRT